MKWSKLKKSIEESLCPEVRGRVEFHSTRYHGTHDYEGRGWITIDKQEIYDMCTLKWSVNYYGLSNELRKVNNCTDWNDPEQEVGYYKAYDDAEKIMEKRGIFSQYEFYESLEVYNSISIEDALGSYNPIIKAISMIDFRLGKRRLSNITLLKGENDLVKRLYLLRCEVAGISPNPFSLM